MGWKVIGMVAWMVVWRWVADFFCPEDFCFIWWLWVLV